MSQRKAFPLRLSPDLYEEVRRWAEAELRSVNGQIEYILRQAIRQRGRGPAGADGQEPPAAGETAGPAVGGS